MKIDLTKEEWGFLKNVTNNLYELGWIMDIDAPQRDIGYNILKKLGSEWVDDEP